MASEILQTGKKSNILDFPSVPSKGTVESEGSTGRKGLRIFKDLWTRIVAGAVTWDLTRQPPILWWTRTYAEKEEEHLHHSLGEKLYKFRFRSHS